MLGPVYTLDGARFGLLDMSPDVLSGQERRDWLLARLEQAACVQSRCEDKLLEI